jgi:hypothetical protein
MAGVAHDGEQLRAMAAYTVARWDLGSSCDHPVLSTSGPSVGHSACHVTAAPNWFGRYC